MERRQHGKKYQIIRKNLHYYDRKIGMLHNRPDHGHAAYTEDAHWYKLTRYIGFSVCDGVGGWGVVQWMASEQY